MRDDHPPRDASPTRSGSGPPASGGSSAAATSPSADMAGDTRFSAMSFVIDPPLLVASGAAIEAVVGR